MSERISEILRFMLKEAVNEELNEDFREIKNELDGLILKNSKKRGELKNSFVKKLLKKESEILREIKRTIQLIRLEKIIKMSLDKVEIKNLTNEEKQFINVINKTLEAKGIEIKERQVIAVVLKEIPAFIGTSGLEYGPFKPGDIIRINKDDLKILIKEGLVKVVGEE